MKQIQKMSLVGLYHFNSKDKLKNYYVVQCLHVEEDVIHNNRKGIVIDIFVDEESYEKIAGLEIGSILDIEVIANLNTNKISFNVII